MVEISILTFALSAGLISFISPCNAALLPTFISYIGSSAKNTKQSIIMSLIFAIGYSTTFAIIGILLSTFSSLITQMKYINLISGSLMVFLSLYLLFNKQFMSKKFSKLHSSDNNDSRSVEDRPTPKTSIETSETELKKTQERPSIIERYSGYGGAFLLGLSLGSAFIPCVTPMYASILTLSIQYETSVQMYLMLLYAIGLTLPYIIIGPLMGKFTSKMIVKLIKYGSKIQKIFSLILLWIGIEIILTGFGLTGILTII
ncbi:cytochrome c biogenesis CcdA family protein [Candidatus Lokiarchaeum ossiferum]|uniref:cytochrome c biogenesis CcdA family protein n=1 Tax=Candidatus Lokiarchaeum ossiferum TaxID=2951803 RepID=UPI00352DBD56